ncbi:1-phosphatidylinositol 4,5-bisphosphate phosphodiesterase eta-2 [Alosa sapidissima]|uniref:1-phosphatidylinositol 4,5-bisphosphate phosphodiesterase eta-2 n=1 Tax=Alosa sapidissima TaxID=34773 RepID=UPI001C09DB3F|nr:1-phosphatidylinositol 4,5-bisphosphate phosphodiesterase eta-2 [Alosa sapidissima]
MTSTPRSPSPAMAPRSSSPLLSPASARRGSNSSSGKRASPSASRSPSPYKEATPGLMTSPKLWQKVYVSRLAEEFFWIGGSIVATPKWKLGQIVERCMCTMQDGSLMLKLRGKSKTLTRSFYLDEHRSCIRWKPSRKREKAKITIDSIHEVCEGRQTEIFQRFAHNNYDPNCCFSIYHGDHMDSLDLVASSAEDARTWITGLKYLLAGISDEDSLAKRQRTRDQWLRQTFTEADKNGDGNLSIGEVLQLLHKLNVNLPREKVKEMFQEADTDDNEGSLAFEEFCAFYKMMSTRRDLYILLLSYSHQKEYMDLRDLQRFLEAEQKMFNVTREHCQEIITLFEPNPQNVDDMVLGIDGFTNYMRSPAGDIFNPEHYQVTQDMTQPLCNYYISSSHNTYLTGDQFLSQSRVDMYAYVLQTGCRCVEVDCWDGPDGEPIVHHGYTLTSKILFKDIVETINKYAFLKSQYPVILSIENHCTVPQQKKMAQYLIEVLQDKLDLSNINANETTKRQPCPELLKGKVLVKGKKLPANLDPSAEEGDVSDESSGEEEEEEEEEPQMNGQSVNGSAAPQESKASRFLRRSFMGSFRRKKKRRSKKKNILEDSDTDPEQNKPTSRKQDVNYGRKRKTMRLSRALSDLVKYTKSVRVHDIETQAYMSSWQVSSLNESITNQIVALKPGQLVRFNQRQLLRVYPSNFRVDSSNFNPQPYWNCGCHMVALNYQTDGRSLELNRAKFAANGNCGFVLKPKCMCKGAFDPSLDDPLPGRKKKQLMLKIISGQQLPKPKDSMLGDRGEIIDPFVEVEIIGLPVDCQKTQTRVVDDNGFNPMWEETLLFSVHLPQIALVRFTVWDHDPIGRDFIGQRTIAFNSMLPGYRHVYLEGVEEASIFVHIAISDISGKSKSNAVKKFLHKASHAPGNMGKGKKVLSETSLSKPFSDDDVSSQGSRGPTLSRGPQSEPPRRAQRVYFQEPLERHRGPRSRMSSEASSIDITYGYINWGSEDTSEPEVQTPPFRIRRQSLSKQESTSSERSDGSPQVIVEGAVLEKEPPPKPSRDPAFLQSSELQMDTKLEIPVPILPTPQNKWNLMVPHPLEVPPRFRRQLAVLEPIDQEPEPNAENIISEPSHLLKPSEPDVETRDLFDQPPEPRTENRSLQQIDENRGLKPDTRVLEPKGQPVETRTLQPIDELSETGARSLEPTGQPLDNRHLQPKDELSEHKPETALEPPEMLAVEPIDQLPESRTLEPVKPPLEPKPVSLPLAPKPLEPVNQVLEPKAVEQLNQPPEPNLVARALEQIDQEAPLLAETAVKPVDQRPEPSQARVLDPLDLPWQNQPSREEEAALPPPLQPQPAVVPQVPLVPAGAPWVPLDPAVSPQVPAVAPWIPQVPALVPQVPLAPAVSPQVPVVVPLAPAVVPQVPQVPTLVPQVPMVPAVVPQVPMVPAVVPQVPAVVPQVPVAPVRQVTYSDQSTQTDPIDIPAMMLYNSPELMSRNRMHLPPIPPSPVPVRRAVARKPPPTPPTPSFTERRSKSVPRRPPQPPATPRPPSRPSLQWQHSLPEQRIGYCSPRSPGTGLNSAALLGDNDSSSGGSLDSVDLSSLPSKVPVGQPPQVGTLQREMDALFQQKIRELRCTSPLLFRDDSDDDEK